MRLFFAAVSFLSALLPAAVLADEGQFTFGYALDLSGKGAFLGIQSRAGAELARIELEREGTPLKIVYGDHRADPKTALTEVNKMLSADKVRAVLSDLSGASSAIAPLLSRANKLMIYQSPAVSILRVHSHAFQNFLDYQAGCRMIAAFFKKEGIKLFASLKVEGEFGELCTRGSAEVYPEQMVLDFVSGDDLRSQLSRLKSERIEGFIQTGFEIDYINQFSAAANLGYKPLVGFPQPLLTKLVREKVGAQADGTVVFGFPQVNPAFIEKLKRAGLYSSMDSVESAAIAYLSVHQLARVFHACLIDETDCEAAELAKQPPDSALGFKGFHQRAAQYDWSLRRLRGGELSEVVSE